MFSRSLCLSIFLFSPINAFSTNVFSNNCFSNIYCVQLVLFFSAVWRDQNGVLHSILAFGGSPEAIRVYIRHRSFYITTLCRKHIYVCFLSLSLSLSLSIFLLSSINAFPNNSFFNIYCVQFGLSFSAVWRYQNGVLHSILAFGGSPEAIGVYIRHRSFYITTFM